MRVSIILVFFLVSPVHGQVVDVNGDGTVGPHEAIAVSQSWKGPASSANDHNHLGQVWLGERNPLTIRGNFPDRALIPKSDEDAKGTFDIFVPQGALILDNTATDQADLLLGGDGIIEAVDESSSGILLRANQNVTVELQADSVGDTASFAVEKPSEGNILTVIDSGFLVMKGDIEARGGDVKVFPSDGGPLVARIFDNGDMNMDGNLTVGGTVSASNVKVIVTDQSKQNESITHELLTSPQAGRVYSGIAALDDQGEATVSLPELVGGFRMTVHYQLTPIGGPAPGLHVAKELEGNGFRIAGGRPGMRISWQVLVVSSQATDEELNQAERG